MARKKTEDSGTDEEGTNRDLRNLGKDLVDGAPPGHSRHP
jgi:hypothetical protein